MSELCKLVTFNGQNVAPIDDALIYHAATNGSGFFYGGEVTIKNANTLHISAGHGIIAGRKFTIYDGDIPLALTTSGTKNGRVYLHLDLSNTAEPCDVKTQIGDSISPPRQDQDVNIFNGVFEFDIALFHISQTTISNLQNVAPYVDANGILSLVADRADNPTTQAYREGEYFIYNGRLYVTATALAIGTELRPNDNIIETTVESMVQQVSGIAPNPMKVFNAQVGDTQLSLYMSPPNDTVVDGQYLSYVAGFKVVRKTGSLPENEADGTLLLDLQGADMYLYENDPYIDAGLTNGTEYYYRAFPYSVTGAVNSSVTGNTTHATPQPYILYGFRIDKNDSNPATRVTYTDMAEGFTPAQMNFTTGQFDYGSWNPENIFFLRGNLPYMVRSNGHADYQLNPNDLTKKMDGTASDITNDSYDGNAMAKFETVWLHQYEEGQYQYCKICNIKLNDNYHAYAHEREDGTIMDHIWLSIYPGASVSSKLRSLSGKTPINTQTGTTELNYAKANGTLWSTRSWAHRNLVNMLLILLGKSTNTQAVYGTGHTTGGSQASNLYKTGRINDKGRFYGTSGQGDVRVFFLDQYWGDEWERIEGCGTNASGNIVVKMKPPYNTALTGYTDTGIKPSGTSGGYQNTDQMTANGLIPKTASGSETTYTADGLWWNTSCYAIVGGNCASGARDGAFCLYVNHAVSQSAWHIGAALSCEQPV